MVQIIQATSRLKPYSPRLLRKTQECHLYQSIMIIILSPVSGCPSTWTGSPGPGSTKHFSCRMFDDMPARGDETHNIIPRVPDQLEDPGRLDMADVPIDTIPPKASLADEVDELVEYATRTASEAASRDDRQTYWQLASDRLRPAFQHYEDTVTSAYNHDHILRHAIMVYYMPRFNRLWPFFSQYCFDPDTLNPVLYLVLVSIGSMYGPDYQKHFGTLLHTRLRRLLAASLFDLEGPEGDMTWLAHARLLTQVQGLYFGQKQGFSYAQVCISQIAHCSVCSRMRLKLSSILVRYWSHNHGV
jgi:hypothetical protein